MSNVKLVKPERKQSIELVEDDGDEEKAKELEI